MVCFLYVKEKRTKKIDFVGLCIIEIKTKAVLTSINDLETIILEDGSKLTFCNIGNLRFRELIKESVYRTQICQHAAATGLKNILLVYLIPVILIKKILYNFCLVTLQI